MDFGNPITEGELIDEGTYGQIISFDLSPQYLDTILQLQLQKTGGMMSDVITTPSTWEDMCGYLEDENCPDIAYCQNGSVVSVLLNKTEYPFVATNRIGFWYYSWEKDVTSLSEEFEMPGESRDLLSGIMLKRMYEGMNRRVPMEIDNKVLIEKAKLGLE